MQPWKTQNWQTKNQIKPVKDAHWKTQNQIKRVKNAKLENTGPKNTLMKNAGLEHAEPNPRDQIAEVENVVLAKTK